MPSTVIRNYDYNDIKKILSITFTTDHTYNYKNVPKKIFLRLAKAFSKGRFFNFNIKNKYEFEKVN